ncbi:MAG: MBL fold metallo-hydrolase, partial [Candidatus Nanopelagicales bacterium]
AVQDLDFFYPDDGPIHDVLSPVRDRFEPWDSDATLFPGLDLRVMPGHTPGSTVIIVSSGQSRAFLVGDIAHCPHELMFADWASMGDLDAARAATSREALADEIARTRAWVGSTHFPRLALGRLTHQGSDRAFEYEVQELDVPEGAGR